MNSTCRCDHNKYSIDYILALSECKRKKVPVSEDEEEEDEGGASDSVIGEGDELDSSDEDFMTNLMEKVT